LKRFFILAIILFTAATTALLYGAMQKGTSIVLEPSAVIESGKNIARVRIGGRIASSVPIEFKKEPHTTLKFAVYDTSLGSDLENTDIKLLPVIYNNLRPDMFQAGRDVILEGEVRDGVMHASSLLTQCPSKYEPPKPKKA